MPRLILPTVALALVLAAPSGAAEKVTWYDRFSLWSGCSPVLPIVFNSSKEAGKIGLRTEDIETVVRSRLRGARLYDSGPPVSEPRWLGWKMRRGRYGDPTLSVSIAVVGFAFDVEVAFRRSVKLHGTALEESGLLDAPATTWRSGSIGTHGRDASYVLSSVSLHMDKFIDEYLRVNADACRKSN